MERKTQAILLVADISGYTKFMKRQTVSITHAKQIIVRLLKSLIKASKPPLKVAELEGDAVFFYAMCSKKDVQKTAEMVKKQLIQLFQSFNKELELIKNMNVCNCDACEKAGELKLKQVVHTGDVELEKVLKQEKLFGVDVIVVHRMLKNTVPSKEYIMMSEPMFTSFVDFYDMQPELRKENFEGIGEVDTMVFYPKALFEKPEFATKERIPSIIQKLIWLLQMGPKTLFDLTGMFKIKGDFKNVPQ